MTIRCKFLILATLFFGVGGSLWAQITQPNFTLVKTETGADKTYQAWDFITMKPGFKFSGADGKTFRAKIQQGIPTLPSSNTYAKADGTITTNPAEGGIVGRIPGRFNVNGGAASYSIPIECPAGINGMQPNISLEYNSQGGDGPVGVGWSIGGLSAITKTTKNKFSDNAIMGISKQNSSFILDGTKLFRKEVSTTDYSSFKLGSLPFSMGADPLGEYFDLHFNNLLYTAPGDTYAGQYENYTQITTHGVIPCLDVNQTQSSTHWVCKSMNPRYFKVTTKSGTIMEYSSKNENPIATDEGTVNYEWLITRITDPNGNYMSFSYEPNDGQTVIKSIEYTGNGSKLPFYKIEFNYDIKTTQRKVIYGDIEKEDKYLLNNVQVLSGSTVVKKYVLNYSKVDEKNFLQNIQLSGMNNQKVNATVFEWGEDNVAITASSLSTPVPRSDLAVNAADRYWLSADTDGDGVDEVINIYPAQIAAPGGSSYLTKNYLQVFDPTISGGQLTLTNGAAYEIGDISYATLKSANPSVLIGDINGDGKKEIIVPQLDVTNGTKVRFKVIGGDSYERPLLNSSQLPVCTVADINNDGIDELIYLEKGKTNANIDYVSGEVCYTKDDGSKMWSPISIALGLYLDALPKAILATDVNNDGLVDLNVMGNGVTVQYINTGSSFVAPDYKVVEFYFQQYLLDVSGSNKTNLSGDFDGNGTMDFLMNAVGSRNWAVKLSNGTTFARIEETLTSSSNSIENEDCIVVDFNHDGKSDVILVNREKNSSGVYLQTKVSWYASTGSGFSISKTFTNTDPNYSFRKYNCTGDFDGDGRQDVLSYGSDIYNGGNKSDHVFVHSAFNTNFEGNMITGITDGMGQGMTISYQPLTYSTTADNKPFYSKGTAAVYPIADVQLPVYCVRSVSEPDGKGGLNSTEFAYTEARAELTGRGFLGFKTQTMNNVTTNRKVLTTTEMDMVNCLPTKTTTDISTSTGTAISKNESTYSNSKTGSIYESLPLKTVSTDYLQNLTSTTDYVHFDGYGNPTEVKTTRGDVVSTQAMTYVQKGSWCPNKPETGTTTTVKGTGSNADTYIRTNSYTYDTKGNLTKQITDVGDVNAVTVEYKDWTVFGQPTTIETTANTVKRTGTISINASGRFVDSKTDVLGQTTSYIWNATTGLLDSETNRLGTTAYTYNGFGQLTRTDYADGTYNENVTQWASEDNAYGAKFYVYQAASATAPVYTWLDGKQREIVKEAYGLGGRKSRTFTQYRADGKLDRVSAPSFDSEPTVWDAVYDYYPDGRLLSVVTPLGTTTTSYDGRTTTVTTPQATQSTVLNAAGQVITSTVNSKTVSYDYYASGKMKSSTPDGSPALTMVYDLQGNRTSLTDPDAGATTAQYNGFGELMWEKQTNNATQGEISTTYTYKPTGLLESKLRNGETTSYGYDSNKRLETIEIAGKHKQTYGYGSYDRVGTLTELIGGTKTLIKELGYDTYGRVNKEIFPSGYYVENHYDDYGNFYKVTDSSTPAKVIWEATEANARGQLTKELKGTKETIYGYDATKGQLTSIVADGVMNYSFGYDAKNNLEYRTDKLLGQKEKYSYDTQNRLTNWDILNSTTNAVLKLNSISYDTQGNISAKSDLNVPSAATLNYEESSKPHRLTSITGHPGVIPDAALTVSYTDFRKISTLNEGGKNYTLSYGVDDERRMSVLTQGSATQTRYYFGDYEEECDNVGNIKKIHYLSGGAMMVNNNGVETLYYGYTDNQGSLVALTNESGVVVEKYAYDPWGARRNPDNWTLAATPPSGGWGVITNRGYTGHEHLDMFNIINMNGRVYDPATAMFFSPDPFVQSPGDWLNYNRYSYCMNNPTNSTDPSGYRTVPDFLFVDNTGGSDSWARLFGGGGGSALRSWDSQHRGSISLGEDGNYYYANGEKASWDEAKAQMYSNARSYEIQTYSISTMGYDHLYTVTNGGGIRLAGSIGGEITGISNYKFDITNGGDGAFLAAAGEVVVSAKSWSGGGNLTSKNNLAFDIDKAVNYLNNHAYQSSQHTCARAVRLALEAGGIKTTDRNSNPKDLKSQYYAKNWGPYLLKKGFREINAFDYFSQKGDIRVFQNYPGGSFAGHIDMNNGRQWVSDFFENGAWPGRGYQNANNYRVYRW